MKAYRKKHARFFTLHIFFEAGEVFYYERVPICPLLGLLPKVEVVRGLAKIVLHTAKFIRAETFIFGTGTGVTPLYGLYWYVRPQRVCFSIVLVINRVSLLVMHFGQK